jgi:signal transduction histidine kinase
LRHNLLNGMNIVLGRANSLEAHVDAEGVRYLETIQMRSEDIVTLIKKIRTFTHATAERPNTCKMVDLAQILEKEIKNIRMSYVDVVVTVTIPDVVIVRADDLLSEVFKNILINAVQHNDKRMPRITVTVEENPDSIVVLIGDNGPGIPDEQKETIFTWQEKRLGSTGDGIGLALVDGLVTQYGGSITVEDGGFSGALFQVELPKPQAEASQNPVTTRGT